MNKYSTLTLVLLTLPVTTFGQEAGSVLFAKGEVSAEREPPVALQKGDNVFEGDTVVTGAASRAQLLMLDGAKVAIRPSSRLRIDEYAYTDPATDATVTATDDKSAMSLLKGGFRTITGAIGKEDNAEYEVRTAVGVLGIRGTDYSAVFCRGDCTWVPGIAAGASIEDGLYLGVVDGRIAFTTPQTTIELGPGEYAFIPLTGSAPELLDEPPAVLLDDNDLLFDADGNSTRGFDATLGQRRKPDASAPQSDDGSEPRPDGDAPESSEAPRQPVIGTDADGSTIDITPGNTPPPQGPRSISYSTGPLGAVTLVWSSTTDNAADELFVDAGNNVTGFQGSYPGRTLPSSATYDIGTSTNVETGFDSMTVLRWGRWSGGTASITLVDGTDVSQSLANQSLHWISGGAGAAPVMPVTGTANYALVGATPPTDTRGNTGVLGNATFFADFTNLIVDSTLAIDINGMMWTASGSGNLGAAIQLPAHLFAGNYSDVTVDGIGGGNGVFSGFFSEPGNTSDPAFPGGVGLTYSLQDAQGTTTVSGAAAFGNP
ncbi:MAG: FecR domain-containing protein [Pseudomonadota bacterium]